MIRNGSRGLEVVLIQERLGLTNDGIFGRGTEAAVRNWQQQNNIPATGVVDLNTWLSMNNVTMDLSRLVGIVPNNVIFQLPTVINRYQINTPLRMAHFLAQCHHESGGFRTVVENLNYTADGLRSIFPRHFKKDEFDSFARQPQRIANRVYSNRMGNGNEASGDGWRFRGRGFIQLTGRENYRLFSQSIGEDCTTNPDLVSEKYPLASAAWFFHRNNINSICDRGSSDDTITQVTRRVNGGTHGLADRIAQFRNIFPRLTR